MQRRTFLTAAFGLPALLAAPALWARPGAVFNTGGIAVNGYDVVAYFTMGKAVEGSGAQAVKWGGATWYFSSAEHRTAFEMNPRTYSPRYGGYCAFAMAQGRVVETVPEAWTVAEGRLYLNESTEVRGLWRQDIAGNIARADSFWPGALG